MRLLQYLRLSLTCMCEAWEDILMQMDLRLTKFVQVRQRCLYGWIINIPPWRFLNLTSIYWVDFSTECENSSSWCCCCFSFVFSGKEYKYSGPRWVPGAAAVGTCQVPTLRIRHRSLIWWHRIRNIWVFLPCACWSAADRVRRMRAYDTWRTLRSFLSLM